MAFKTTILFVLSADEKKKKSTLLLSGGDFHPSGGGQPGDSGKLFGDDFLFRVLDTEKNEAGLVVTGKLEYGTLSSGLEVEGEVDVARHILLSRMHTGEHILSRALEVAIPSLSVFKVAVDIEETTVYLTYPGELSWDMLFAGEKEANRIILENHPVEITYLQREEAKHLPGIKGNWGRITGDTIRVVRIPGFDNIACSGSHVLATGEVGELFISGYRGSAPGWEIKFTVEGGKKRQEYSETARRLVRGIGCRVSQLEGIFSGLQGENAALKKMLEKAALFLELPREEYMVEGVVLSISVLPGFSRELVAPSARKWSENYPEAVFILLLPELEKSGGSFLLYRGGEVPYDFSPFLKETPSLQARGGGRSDWLNGLSPIMKPEAWLDGVQNFIQKKRS